MAQNRHKKGEKDDFNERAEQETHADRLDKDFGYLYACASLGVSYMDVFIKALNNKKGGELSKCKSIV